MRAVAAQNEQMRASTAANEQMRAVTNNQLQMIGGAVNLQTNPSYSELTRMLPREPLPLGT